MGHAISSAGGGAGAAGDEGYPREGSTKARHVAWAAVLLTGWLLGYSIGWQRGWLVGNSGSDEQFKRINQTLKETQLGAATADDDSREEGADSA